jgi:hypothetical protein
LEAEHFEYNSQGSAQALCVLFGGRIMKCTIFALAIVVALFYYLQPADAVHASNFERLQAGMRLKEVEKLLGGPGSQEVFGMLGGLTVRWQGRGRNVITAHFCCTREGGDLVPALVSKEFFNPSRWDLIKEWWGEYQLPFDLPFGIWTVATVVGIIVFAKVVRNRRSKVSSVSSSKLGCQTTEGSAAEHTLRMPYPGQRRTTM